MYRHRSDDPRAGERFSLLWPDPDLGPWWVALNFAIVAGRPDCVGVELRSCREPGEAWPEMLPMWNQEPPTVTQKVWRGVPVLEMIRDVRRQLTEVDAGLLQSLVHSPDLQGDEEARLQLRRELAVLRQHLAGPNALPGSVYEEVARVYRQAWSEGRAPTRAVAEHFTISESAAAKRVMRARRAGFLPPTEKGVPGVRNTDPRP